MKGRRKGQRLYLEPVRDYYNPYNPRRLMTEKELRQRYGDTAAEAHMREIDAKRQPPAPEPPPVTHALSIDWQPEADRHLAECACGWLSEIPAWAFATEAAAAKEAARRFDQHMKGKGR